MIKHIVMWKLKETAEGKTKEENAVYIKNILEALKDEIEEIIRIEVGINYLEEEGAYDLVLYSEFTSKEDVEIYQNHPEHLKVAEYVGKVRETRVVVDYES